MSDLTELKFKHPVTRKIQTEQWRPIPGFLDKNDSPIYYISNLSRILSFAGICPRILKNRLDSRGYYHVCLHSPKRKKDVLVHKIMAEVWLGPAPAGYTEINHLKGKTNNEFWNIEWSNRKANIKHAMDNNLIPKGLRHYNTDRKLYTFKHSSGKTFTGLRIDFIKKYDLETTSVCRVVLGEYKAYNGWQLAA